MCLVEAPISDREISIVPCKGFGFYWYQSYFSNVHYMSQIHFGPLIQHISKNVMVRRRTRMVPRLTFLECYLLFQQLDFSLGC